MARRKTEPNELSIVILSYNVSGLLKDCLKSIYSAQKPTDSWQVIVVDNASSDDSVSMVKKNFPQVKLIVSKTNTGFSAGNNLALKKVSTPYTLLLNPDTIVYPDTISTVLKYVQGNPDVGAATCRVELPDGSLDYSCHRRFPNPANAFVYFFTGLAKKSSYAYTSIPSGIHEIDSLCGAFALIRTSVGKDLGWFDEAFWWNGEDLDLCYRIKQSGYKIIYLPQVKIIHFKGSSSGLQKSAKSKTSQETKIRTTLSGIKAMRIFYDKHYAQMYPVLFNWFIYTGMWVLRNYRQAKIKLGFGI